MVRFIIVININAIGGRECNTSLQYDALPLPLPPPVVPLGRMRPCGAHQYLQWRHWPLLLLHKALTVISDGNYACYCDMSQISHEICRLRPDLISFCSHTSNARWAICVRACVRACIWHPMFKPRGQPGGIIRTRREWNSMENWDFERCCDRVTLKGRPSQGHPGILTLDRTNKRPLSIMNFHHPILFSLFINMCFLIYRGYDTSLSTSAHLHKLIWLLQNIFSLFLNNNIELAIYIYFLNNNIKLVFDTDANKNRKFFRTTNKSFLEKALL